MKNVFLDCGTHYLEGFEKLYKICGVQEDWEVYCFEVVEELIPVIKNKDLYKKLKNVTLINKAVWIKDGKIPLTLDLEMGDTFAYGGATNILGDNYKKPEYIHHELRKNARLVDTFDLSKFILDNFSKEDHLVVKLDIEGAEYEVLDKMILDGSLDYVDTLIVEWHNHLLEKKYDQDYFMREIMKRNISFIPWT